MERIQASTVTRQFKRTFGDATLNELGWIFQLCRRERDITLFRRAVSLIESFASGSALRARPYRPSRLVLES